MKNLTEYLKGGDLRSIGDVNRLVSVIKTQKEFDELFQHMFSDDRLTVMRAADAIEKITLDKPEFLHSHKKAVIRFLDIARHKEFKWHLALMVSRLKLSEEELEHVWGRLTQWASDNAESKIVRVNSLQALFNLKKFHKNLVDDFSTTVQKVKKEEIPSINARLKKFKKK